MSLDLLNRYKEVRTATLGLTQSIDPRFANLQADIFVSPIKWHLAHSTWFFEKMILNKFVSDYKDYDSSYNYLFNSYYNSLGERQPRDKRKDIESPDLNEVLKYRQQIDQRIIDLLQSNKSSQKDLLGLVELGINHEEQHQELIITDIKYSLFHQDPNIVFSQALKQKLESKTYQERQAHPSKWIHQEERIVEIGHDYREGFAFDNEGPRHKFYLQEYLIATQLVSNEEYLEFIEDNAYNRPELWLSDAWTWIQEKQIQAPLYWIKDQNEYSVFTLAGLQRLNLNEPVTHVSFYEADAFARWEKLRLPREEELEAFAVQYPIAGHFQEENIFHPSTNLEDLHVAGKLWQFSSSPYRPYPRYKQAQAELGEYNGKFMINQLVLRGGSCATPIKHYRHSYRNFFYPQDRWQFTGIRLARDVQ